MNISGGKTGLNTGANSFSLGPPLFGINQFPGPKIPPFGLFSPQQYAMMQANQMLLNIKQSQQALLNSGIANHPLMNMNMNLAAPQMPNLNTGLPLMNQNLQYANNNAMNQNLQYANNNGMNFPVASNVPQVQNFPFAQSDQSQNFTFA